MTVYENLHRFAEYYNFEQHKSLKYNYKQKGLIERLISPVLYNTKNVITKKLVTYVESGIMYMLKCIDIYKNRNNWTSKNR